MKNNCCWVNYKWVTIQRQIFILQIMSECIRLVKLCFWKKLNEAASADTSNLAARKYFIALKGEDDKQGINKLVNIPTG